MRKNKNSDGITAAWTKIIKTMANNVDGSDSVYLNWFLRDNYFYQLSYDMNTGEYMPDFHVTFNTFPMNTPKDVFWHVF